MPSNIAHMLIAYKALRRLEMENISGLNDFVGKLLEKKYKSFVNLGSIGPDLFYYDGLYKDIVDMWKIGAVGAKGVEPWSYHTHSVRPNELPLKLIEITFKDRENGLKDQDFARLAFVAGFLSHIAADQIIHPLVNGVVGPYYRSGKAREEHRKCEVFQDLFLYNDVYHHEDKKDRDESGKYDFFQQNFQSWADISTFTYPKKTFSECSAKTLPGAIRQCGWKRFKGWLLHVNTAPWFRYFIQRGFAEAYQIFMEEKDIKSSVDNLLLVLCMMTRLGPYKDAREEYNRYRDFVNRGGDKQKKIENYRKYIEEPRYLWSYRKAVELSAIYTIALYEVYEALKNGEDFTDERQQRFLRVVRDADLSAPLEKELLSKAAKELCENIGDGETIEEGRFRAAEHFSPVLSKTIDDIKEPTEVVTWRMPGKTE